MERNPGGCIDRRVAELRTQSRERLVGAGIAVRGDGAHQFAVIIDECVVDRPCVDTDGVDRSAVRRRIRSGDGESFDDVLKDHLERPAEPHIA